jgi:hypothetical protein
LIESFRSRGYEVQDFFTANADSRHLILRHDIDVSLDAALEMAAIEAALGVKATYFARVTGEFYNLFAPSGVTALRRLIALGHEVGLHFDAALLDDRFEVLDAEATKECAWLESLADAPVRILSFHRPAKSLLGYDRALAGRVNTYAPRYFHDIGYCSDSRGAFHHGEPLAHAAIAAGKALQLLIHPIWWGEPTGAEVSERLEAFIERHAAVMRRALATEIESYRRPLAPRA